MNQQSAYQCVKDAYDKVVAHLKSQNLTDEEIQEAISAPDEYRGVGDHAVLRQLGYLEGFADGCEMTVLELLDFLMVSPP